MNVLEHYIKSIDSEEPYTAEWTKDFPDKKFVKVVLTVDCYGITTVDTHVFNTVEWDKIKEQGYYMG